MHSYIAKGNEGFDSVKDCKYAVTMENAIRMIALLQRFYKPNESFSSSTLSASATINSLPDLGGSDLVLRMNRRKSSKSDRLSKYMESMVLIDDKYFVEIAPVLDGRVKIINPAKIE